MASHISILVLQSGTPCQVPKVRVRYRRHTKLPDWTQGSVRPVYIPTQSPSVSLRTPPDWIPTPDRCVLSGPGPGVPPTPSTPLISSVSTPVSPPPTAHLHGSLRTPAQGGPRPPRTPCSHLFVGGVLLTLGSRTGPGSPRGVTGHGRTEGPTLRREDPTPADGPGPDEAWVAEGPRVPTVVFPPCPDTCVAEEI